VTLRRRTPLKQSSHSPTDFPPDVKAAARARDRGCLGPRAGMPEPCLGEVAQDHIRASGAIGQRSRNTLDNAASLCVGHHDLKTRYGRVWRPALIDLVNELMGDHSAHVDPCGAPECPAGRRISA
jgi:hypothetical protein